MKTSHDIRREYIDFFVKRDHSIIRGTPLFIPDDPTLLFANAGMNQFKPIFLNKIEPSVKRAVNSQRCMRVSGKHNDLEEVGFSPHHHTLFEMMGNWSFGDYYKKEAITWAWKLLTEIWGLPKNKLWVTVFRDEEGIIPEDAEAADFWSELTDVDSDKIKFFGRKDNFWEMGESGPCGPCTEIHIDRGPDFCDKQNIPGHVCSVNGDCKRIVELWNLVFIQYNRINSDTLLNLPSHHVDTGMGLERVTAVMQNAPSNYDTDLFLPIIDSVQTMSGQTNEQRTQNIISYRVIADHIRAASFLLADGVMPSNEWRGYVLRRIIRRAVRFGTKIGFSTPFLCRAAESFFHIMAPVYPELRDSSSHIVSMLRSEEERFFKTLEQGLPMVNDLVASILRVHERILPGEEVFKLYDTFGFPVDITREIAKEAGLTIDETGFQTAMNAQKTRARSAWKQDTMESGEGFWSKLSREVGAITFTGYDTLQNHSTIVAIVSDDRQVPSASESDASDLFLVINPSPFYAESGGQIGDTGILETPSARVKIVNTFFATKGLPVVQGNLMEGSIKVGDKVLSSVQQERRKAIARNHTATHLLHSSLRRVLGDHVKQSGSLVTADRLRFDFSHFSSISGQDILEIEHLVNNSILANFDVTTEVMSLDEAIDSGVTALFGEKYEDSVRVLRVNNISAELCGGTHVSCTGEIGMFKILSESSISAGIRRIEAVTGFETLHRANQWVSSLQDIADTLKSPVDTIKDRVLKMQKKIRDLNREVNQLQSEMGRHEVKSKLDAPSQIGGINVIIHSIPGLQPTQLRDLADQIRQKLASGVTILGSVVDDKVFLIAAVSNDLTKTIHAGKLVSRVAEMIGGGGGGRPDMAQAGGNQPKNLPEAMEKAPAIIASMIADHGGQV